MAVPIAFVPMPVSSQQPPVSMAAAHNDFITPSVVSAAEGDYERNLANCVELVHVLLNDKDYALHNKIVISEWIEKHGKLCLAAAVQLQPIWSQPRVKVASFTEALDQARNRLRMICAETGLAAPSIVA
jgi:propane 2-monooxygenase small subunit